jgi:nucleoside-diphosphate-sugar epimerase
MTTLVIGSGLIGSQVARILAERGEKPVLMDVAAQTDCIGQIVDLAKVTLIQGDVLRPLTIVDALRTHNITKIAHTAANPLLTVGAQKEPYAAINLNIMGTVNVLEAARITGLKRVVVSSSSVLNSYLSGGEDSGDFGREEAFPRPTTFYSATKQAVESLGLNYAKWCGIEFAGLRYGAVFGPWSGAGGGGPSNIIRAALKDALADAKAKAEALAAGSGLTLGEIGSMSEGSQVSGPQPLYAAAGKDAAMPIEPGTQTVDATVTVTYEAAG